MEDLDVLYSIPHKGFLIVQEHLLRYLGGDGTTALFFTKLLLSYQYFQREAPEKVSDGWFFMTSETIESSLGINTYKQSQCVKKLVELNLLESERRGYKGKRHFKIDLNYYLNTVMFEDVEEKEIVKDKTSFYKKLNDCICISEYKEALDKIPKHIGEFIFAFSRLMANRYDIRMEWSSISYGKLRSFWKNIARTPFDYSILLEWVASPIYGDPLTCFFTFYSLSSENPVRKTLPQIMKETKLFDEGEYFVQA